MAYTDAHVHVWTHDTDAYPFAAGHDPAKATPPTVTPEEVLGHARPCGVERIVLVQMSYYFDDNRYLLQVMDDHPGVFAGIGIVDPAGEAPGERMRRLGRRGLRGFRVAPWGQPVATWCDGPGYDAMFAVAAREGLALCPLIGPDGLPALRRRCEEFPDAPVVIDHLCRLGAGGPIRDVDVDALCALAHHENVMVKVSAFYALSQAGPPYHDLTELIHRVADAFGPQRLMWASDTPFQVQPPHTYAASVALIEGLDFLGDDERAAILGGTAARVFFA